EAQTARADKLALEFAEQAAAAAREGYVEQARGVIYRMRGELDRAEEMCKKALAINEKLGRQEGMANQYGNLGGIAKDRGDIGRARKLWTQARDLFAKIGMPHQVETAQGWLDELPPG
ncbi:MAG: tetratricopeptide repeat protein, partial [Geminicoccales bacterium]